MRPLQKVWVALSLLALLLGAGFMAWRQGVIRQPPIRIGVLHSLTGTMALNEKPLVDAVRLAVEEINAKGGLLGRQLEIVLVDGKSSADIAAVEAERLINQEKVSVLFGCWTSACRKAVKPIVEKHQHLLIYPVQYEGMELSPNILYTGAVPSQQIIPGTRWAMRKFGPRVYLVGSDYIFPHTANAIIQDLAQTAGGEVVAERYLPLGSVDVMDVIEDIRRTKPDIVLNTINGDSNAAFFAALEKAGLAHIPLVSFSVEELGMKAWGGARLSQHYAVWSYFQSLPGEENRRFIRAYQARFGADRLLSDPIEASYDGVRIWAQAVQSVGHSEPVYVNQTLRLQSINGPSGIMAVDSATRHVWKYLRLGKVLPNAQFEQVYASDMPLRPEPWPEYRSRAAWQRLLEGGKP